MSNVPTNLVPTRISQLPEAPVADPAGYFPIVISGTTYKVQFSQIQGSVEVPASRRVNAGTGLTGGGSLSADITIAVANGGIGDQQLDVTGVSAGTYGDGANMPVVTVNTKGRVTSLSTTPLVISGYVPDSRQVVAGTGLSGGGNLSADRTLAISFSSATPQPLGSVTAGTGVNASRDDHVHPALDLSDSNQTTGTLPMGRGGTGSAMSPVAGAVVVSNGTNFDLTSVGTPGQVLASNGSGIPTWLTITGAGTVTSVDGSGGTTGLTVSGGPITGAGTLTLGGTLAISAGGTGLAGTPTNGQLLVGNGSGYTLASLSAGTAISVTNATGSISIANTAPDQTVVITGGGLISVTGTYPSFNVSATEGFSGTVTSIDVSSTVSGLTFSGGPVTDSGVITMAGTLGISNGGTGASTQSDARIALGLGTMAVQDANSVNITGGNVSVGSATITTLTGTSANITTLSGTTLTYTSGTVTNLAVTSLTVSSLSLTNATFTSATITTLKSTSATIDNLASTSANITTLTSSSGTVTNLLATTANISSILFVGTTTNTNSSKLVVSGTISETVGTTQYLVASQYDVGTNPNQIPLNQYLGSMAFQSSAAITVTDITMAGSLTGTIAGGTY
jgi:hypothetical protein